MTTSPNTPEALLLPVEARLEQLMAMADQFALFYPEKTGWSASAQKQDRAAFESALRAALARPQEVAEQRILENVVNLTTYAFMMGEDKASGKATIHKESYNSEMAELRENIAASRAPVAVGVEPTAELIVLREAVQAMIDDGWISHGPEGMSEAQDKVYRAYLNIPKVFSGAGGSVGAEPAYDGVHGHPEFGAGAVSQSAALCAVCGLSRHVAAHRHLVSGPDAGEPLDHAFTIQAQDAAPVELEGLNPYTDNLVNCFASHMKRKLLAAQKKYGYTDGWRSPDWMDECRAQLLKHIAKGDPVDVSNYCAFLWFHGVSTAAPVPAGVQGDAARLDFVEKNCILILDSVTKQPGGNGGLHVAPTREAIDAAMRMPLYAALPPPGRGMVPMTDVALAAETFLLCLDGYTHACHVDGETPGGADELVDSAEASMKDARYTLVGEIFATRQRAAK